MQHADENAGHQQKKQDGPRFGHVIRGHIFRVPINAHRLWNHVEETECGTEDGCVTNDACENNSKLRAREPKTPAEPG